jgi:ankyrin repeat protein
MGNMDDVVIDVTSNKRKVSFAIQLKHKDAENKRLSSGTLEAEKGDFSLKKYCESFKGLSDVNKRRQFILYTNAKFDPKRSKEVKNFTMIQDDCFDEIFNTSSGGGNVYRFEVNDKTPQDGKIKKSDYEIFFSRFRLFVCQKNVKDIELDTIEILNTKDIVPKYLDLFRKWHQDRFTNKVIDKTTVNVHLIDIFLSPFIISNRYFPVGQHEKLKLFEKVIKEFDVTLVNDSFEHFKKNLTHDYNPEEGTEEMFESYKELYKIGPTASADEIIMRLAKKMKIIDKSVKVLENEIKLKVLQYAFEKPIIVNFNETSKELIYKIMKLHQLGSKIKFILVGEKIQSTRLSRFRTFENVSDLRSNNDELYSEVTRTCRLSLQGRKETTLEELIDSCEEICEHVGAKELLQMLKGKFLIGQATESVPPFYINRKIYFKAKTIDEFLDGKFIENNLAVVKFDRKMRKIQDEIPKRNIKVLDVQDYLNTTHISNEPTIISTNEECSKQLLQDVSEKSNNKSLVYLRISEDKDFLIISIEENHIHGLIRPLNILCADPGMGKTTMLKNLKKECDSRFWTIEVDLKTHNEFFKTKHDADGLLNHLIEGNEKSFSKHIKDAFRSKKKVYFFFDGLDEVEKSCVDNVLDSVKELSSKGFHIWIASRKNLKTKLEDRFGKVVMDMEEIEEEQQKFYIENRLMKEYNHEQRENIISNIFNNSDIDNNCQILGKVLQLYIITQNFLDDKELHRNVTEHTFLFTKMYDLFFRGRFEHNRNKESKNPTQIWADVEDTLEIYEHLAVHSVLDDEVFQKLKMDLRRAGRFLNKIKMNKDPLGIVTKINDEGKAVFEHPTYGEYFAARFFSNNFDKARLIREELFSDGHNNLMMILSAILAEDNPLHLAVIYQNMDQIEKYIDDKNVHDKAGRNPLHLATYIEPRFVSPKSCFIVSIETIEYLTNISILKRMVKFNYADCDKLFQWNALVYAFENKSFVSVEMILKRCEYSKEELHQYIKKYINNDNCVLFCLTHGCRKLLSAILENSERSNKYLKRNNFTIIEHTIKNCYFKEDKTLRFVIDTLKYNFYLNSTNDRGETVLQLAAKYGKTYAVQMLLEEGADEYRETKYQQTPLTLAPQNGHEQNANLLMSYSKTISHPTFGRMVKIPRRLTQNGISTKDIKNNNEFPLHLAAYSGNVKKVKLLIDDGEIVDAVTNFRETPLHVAVSKGNVDIAELLIEEGASVNALTTDNETPLHWAAQLENSKTAELLIEKGASVNAFTTRNETPLHRAAQSENSKTAELLIEKGASVNALGFGNVTPLHWAAQSENSKTAELLIEKGASVTALTTDNETPLHRTAQLENSKTAELLIEKGASVNAFTTRNETPLHRAAQGENSKTAELLIEKGASVNALGIGNVTPLHLAAQLENSKTAELLIEKGASVNALGFGNETPLHRAAQSENSKTAELLIEKGASVNALGIGNVTPLHLAAQLENSKTAELLIEKGASVNAFTNRNETPLHRAAQSENSKTAELLIEKGASVNALTTDNQTPLHWAVDRGNIKTAKLLIEKGASVNALTTNNQTPLHRAAQLENSKTAELLIEKGASVNALGFGNETPLHRAAQFENSKTAELLIEKGASVNAFTTRNETPLHRAAQLENSKTAELLIEKGASVTALTTDNQTPLHWAVDRGNIKTAELLIGKGASVNAFTTLNETPLHRAAQRENSKIAELLIEKGASVNALGFGYVTPLHRAAQSENSKTAELLIEKGASVTALTADNETPLHRAAQLENSKTAELLIEKGASVNALGFGNETPLHRAAQSENSKTAELLIEKGASVNALTTDYNGLLYVMKLRYTSGCSTKTAE